MPRIPLYNQGQGPAVQLATGSLSRQASMGAFTAPGKALASFGEKASDIAYQFGIQERNRQDRTILAEEELAAKDYFGTKLIEDQSLTKEEAETNFNKFRDDYIQKIEGKGYSDRRKQLVIGAVNNVYAQRGLDAKINAFNRGTKKATETDELFLEANLETLRTFPVGSPQYEKALADNARVFETAASENRKLKYTPQSYELQVKIDRANLAFESARTPAQVDAAYEALREDKSIPPGKLLQAKNLRDATKEKLSNELYDNTLEAITEAELSASEAQQIEDGFNAGEDFEVTRANGDVLSFSVSDMPITKRRAISKIAKATGDEFNKQTRAATVSDINDGFEKGGVDGAMAIAKVAFDEYDDPEQADLAILNAARGFDAQAKIKYAEGDFDSALDYAKAAEDLITESFKGRPSVSESSGEASNTILKSVAKTRIDVQEDRDDKARINIGIAAAESGTLDNYAGIYTEKEQNQILNTVMDGKSLPEQIEIIETNNVKFEPFKGVLEGAATEGLGATPDIVTVKDGLELYRQIKTRAPGIIDKHTDTQTRAFYDSVLLLESVGVETDDAIARVNKSYQSGIDINAKYSTVKSGVDAILDTQVTTILGIPLSGEKVDNRTYVHEAVEKVAKVYIGMGTMTAEQAVQSAVEAVVDSHINVRGQLIPRRKNYPFYPRDEDLRRMIDLASEDYISKYKEQIGEDAKVSLIPFPNRVDEWMIVVNGVQGVSGTDAIYTKSDLEALMAGDRKTEVDTLIQENLEKRGLTEIDKLSDEIKSLNVKARELTGSNLARIRREQGEDAYKAAIAERQRLQDEAASIEKLLKERKALERGN